MGCPVPKLQLLCLLYVLTLSLMQATWLLNTTWQEIRPWMSVTGHMVPRYSLVKSFYTNPRYLVPLRSFQCTVTKFSVQYNSINNQPDAPMTDY
jgi:hypothetical protein